MKFQMIQVKLPSRPQKESISFSFIQMCIFLCLGGGNTLSIIPTIICFSAALFLHETLPPTTTEDTKEQRLIFHFFKVVAIIVAFYLLAFDVFVMPSSNSDAEAQINEPLFVEEVKKDEDDVVEGWDRDVCDKQQGTDEEGHLGMMMFPFSWRLLALGETLVSSFQAWCPNTISDAKLFHC
ncbi:hypothetical protein LOK49_LG06G02348 [Camellia lanceoleosa]|uniref:Uncharacterized protein n=1 Tax=Camellia lanceoleosa TaxID=1840588 RepID=A0ACC0HHS0_9ERIC|nr:hypothetical protein LOK49_LG06G02348 [Camellia lanceoleosa]